MPNAFLEFYMIAWLALRKADVLTTGLNPDAGSKKYTHIQDFGSFLTLENFPSLSLVLRGGVRYMTERRRSPKKVAENRKRPK